MLRQLLLLELRQLLLLLVLLLSESLLEELSLSLESLLSSAFRGGVIDPKRDNTFGPFLGELVRVIPGAAVYTLVAWATRVGTLLPE